MHLALELALLISGGHIGDDEDDHYGDPDYDDSDCNHNQYNDVSYDLRCSIHIVDDQLCWGSGWGFGEIYSIR